MRRAKCYLARLVLALITLAAIVAANFVPITLDNSLFWSDTHTTLLSLLTSAVAAVIICLVVVFGGGFVLYWLWHQAFGSQCKRP